MKRRLIYGVHPVEEAFKQTGGIHGVLVTRRDKFQTLLREAERHGVPVQTVQEDELALLCGSSSHQGIAVLAGEYQYWPLEQLLAPSEEAKPLLVVLDSVTDPQNLGAIIRASLVLGASGLVLPKDRAASITPVVVRVSAGASEHLPCARVTNIARALEQIKEAGCWVVGAVESGGITPEAIDMREPTALVLGNEQKGIRPLVLKSCDLQVTIPSCSSIASLNVAAAGISLLSEAARQRRAQG